MAIYPRDYKFNPQYYLPNNSEDIQFHSEYGKKHQVKLKFGDCLLFHSQVIHDSPTKVPVQNRLSVELRIASNVYDNNFQYRRLFVDIRNFK